MPNQINQLLMSSALRIPVFDTDYEPRSEREWETVRPGVKVRRREPEYREEREEHHDRNHMAEVAGGIVIGAVTLGILGGMMRR